MWSRYWLLLLMPILLAGCAGSETSFLNPKGPVAVAQQALFYKVIGLMLIVVVPVFVLTPLFAWRYRRRNAASTYRPKWDFSWPLEIAIWGLPILIVVILGIMSWTKSAELDPYKPLPAKQPPLEVQVVGLDWKWLFIYPEQKIAAVGELVFPVDRPLHLKLTSDTVMQSFFIPSLGSQIYAMAGMQTELHLKAHTVGRFQGENTQFSGMGFHKQRFSAKAVTTDDFAGWLSTVRASPKRLDEDAYQVLSTKSVIGSPILYADVAPDLFQKILAKHTAWAVQETASSGAGHHMERSR